ncbi:MAG: hypothetical protein GY856_07950 [bacterium]|nr:hypothetical protein [bacterium]
MQVRDPASGESFTEAGAWHFIADLLESGHPIDEVVLRKPPGKLAYAMIVDLAPGQPALYVKLQLGSGKVIGRSFHYTEVAPPQVRSEEDSTNEDPKNGE